MTQPFSDVVPEKVPAPVPLSAMFGMAWSAPPLTAIASAPRFAAIAPFGGATMDWSTIGGLAPMLGHVTVEVIRM